VAAQQFAEDRAIPWLEFAAYERMHRLSRALIRLAGYPLLWNPLQRLLDQKIREERERRGSRCGFSTIRSTSTTRAPRS
jgi:hypothetical protein